VVANVKQNNNENELKIILSEYEKKLVEMEKDNNQSSEKLNEIIETLQKEKQALNERLIRANQTKLKHTKSTSEEDDSLIEEKVGRHEES
jgi:uncharacterized phage infection (PIP) family protein YhgE